MSAPIVTAQALQLGYHRHAPLFSVPITFEIPDQKISAIIGTNGSGKSTLIKSLVGEPHVLAGKLQLFGEDAQELTPQKLKRLVSFVPQEPRFPGHLQLESYLKFSFLGDMGWFDETTSDCLTAIAEMLDLFGLTRLQFQSLSSLSSGERQRAFLARAFLQNSRLLLLDEPSNHLDPKATRTLAETLKRAVSVKAKSVVFATHDRLLVEAIANYALAIGSDGLGYHGSVKREDVAGVFSKVFG